MSLDALLDPALLLAALVLTLGVALQTAVGFGLGLVCVPLLVWVGQPLPTAVALLSGAGLVQAGLGTFAVREHVRVRALLPLFVIACVALPIGQWLMGRLIDAGPVAVKQAVGALLLVVLLARRLIRPAPRPVLHPGVGYLAASVSGLLTGLVGMGGPPLVLYAVAHTWTKEQYRAFLWPLFFAMTPLMVGALALRFGGQVLLEFLTGLALAPCAWVGTRLGMVVSDRWSMPQLERGALMFLYVIAFVSVIAPLLPT